MAKKSGIVNANSVVINNSVTPGRAWNVYTYHKDSDNLKIGQGNKMGSNIALSIDSNLVTSGTFSGTFIGSNLGSSQGTDGYDNGIKNQDFVINWSAGTNQSVGVTTELTASSVTLTASFSNIQPFSSYQLFYSVHRTNMEIYFNHSIFWPGGIRPSLSNASGSRDILNFTTDGDSNIYGTALFNFSASVG